MHQQAGLRASTTYLGVLRADTLYLESRQGKSSPKAEIVQAHKHCWQAGSWQAATTGSNKLKDEDRPTTLCFPLPILSRRASDEERKPSYSGV